MPNALANLMKGIKTAIAAQEHAEREKIVGRVKAKRAKKAKPSA